MRKLVILLLLTITTAYASFSQVDTGKVALPDTILKRAIVDIVRGDECREQVRLLNAKIEVMNRILNLKDSVIGEQLFQIRKYQDIVQLDSSKSAVQDKEIADYKKKYRRLKVRDRMKMGLAATVILGLLYIVSIK